MTECTLNKNIPGLAPLLRAHITQFLHLLYDAGCAVVAYTEASLQVRCRGLACILYNLQCLDKEFVLVSTVNIR